MSLPKPVADFVHHYMGIDRAGVRRVRERAATHPDAEMKSFLYSLADRLDEMRDGVLREIGRMENGGLSNGGDHGI